MDTIHISFEVHISETRYSRYDDGGKAEMEFDVPSDLFAQGLDYSVFMNGLVRAAYNSFLKSQTEKSDGE